MSVQLGELKAIDGKSSPVEVEASNFDADLLVLQQDEPGSEHPDVIIMDRKQLQELSQVIDRFLDR
jgi:hypothetical protein